ncbi:MAG: hypothetical protein NZM37_12860, partial [Sandaracinaceae bacterium]|nr:hypothetical protein [Sandaracinaceae bacterium]MDW8247650.1 hypothetical protein [Sandaracinaceae bacterium]
MTNLVRETRGKPVAFAVLKPKWLLCVFFVLSAIGACSGMLSRTTPSNPPSDSSPGSPDSPAPPGMDAAPSTDTNPSSDTPPSPSVDAHQPPSDTSFPSRGTRVFFSGHSLINLNTPAWFAQLSERAGMPVRYQLQMAIGSPMSVRLACPRSGQDANGGPITFRVLEELSRPDAYDTLIVTERHDIITTILYEASTSMARRFRDALRRGNPRARAFLFESWFNIDLNNPRAFVERQRRELVAWQCIASRVNESRGDMPPMLVVPA